MVVVEVSRRGDLTGDGVVTANGEGGEREGRDVR